MTAAAIRIICVGNRLQPGDAAGPRVYERLRRNRLPPGVEVIDGGTGGLNLLRWLDGAGTVVFVDSVSGFTKPGRVVVLSAEEAAAGSEPLYGHAAGLAYLLNVLPAVHEGTLPRLSVVGIEGAPDERSVSRAARLSLAIALGETLLGPGAAGGCLPATGPEP